MTSEDILKEIHYGNKEKAIQALYKEYFPLIRKYIYQNNGSSDDAKDVFQDTVITIFTKINEDKQLVTNIKSLVLTIAKNKWIDKKRRDKKINYTDDISSVKTNSGHPKMNPFEQFSNQEKSMLMDKVLSSLGDRCKELLINVIFYDCSMKEIAEMMQFSSEDSAKTQHYKCRQKLISLYKDDVLLKNSLKNND